MAQQNSINNKSSTLTVDSGLTVSAGGASITGALTANSGTDAISISTDAANTTVDIGTGAGAKTVTLGSTNGASKLDLKYGTSDFSLASASGNVMVALDSGEITKPLQPAFLAGQASVLNNVTGNGTAYRLGATTALTTIFDQGSDFNTNGTFTAPVTGRYYIGAQATFIGCATATTAAITLQTSNRAQVFAVGRPASSTNLYTYCSTLTDMDAGDTFTCEVTVSGEAADTVDIFGNGTDIFTGMWGNLVC